MTAIIPIALLCSIVIFLHAIKTHFEVKKRVKEWFRKPTPEEIERNHPGFQKIKPGALFVNREGVKFIVVKLHFVYSKGLYTDYFIDLEVFDLKRELVHVINFIDLGFFLRSHEFID